MERSIDRSRRNQRLRRIAKKTSETLALVELLSREVNSQRQVISEFMNILEDRVLFERPITAARASVILQRKYPIYSEEDVQRWDSIVAKWRRASELRGLVRAAPMEIRERLLALLSGAKERDSLQHILEHHPLTTEQQQSLDILTAAWFREEELREAVRNGGVRLVERFIALVRMDIAVVKTLDEPASVEIGVAREASKN